MNSPRLTKKANQVAGETVADVSQKEESAEALFGGLRKSYGEGRGTVVASRLAGEQSGRVHNVETAKRLIEDAPTNNRHHGGSLDRPPQVAHNRRRRRTQLAVKAAQEYNGSRVLSAAKMEKNSN